MLPAHQHFRAYHHAAVIHLRLVIKHELLILQGKMDILLHRHPACHRALHVWIKETHGVAAGHFGLIHGNVRALQQLINAFAARRDQGCAYAGRAAMLVPAQPERLRESGQNLVAHPLHLCDRTRLIGIELVEDHHKFVAAQSRHGIGIAHAKGQAVRHFAQQLIADIVSEGIIQLLEVIQVDQQQS